MLDWMKMFCFIFGELKTDTFENTIVWMGPKTDAKLQSTRKINNEKKK